MSALKRRLSDSASNFKSGIALKGEEMKLQRQQKNLEKLQVKQEAQRKALEEQQKRTQEKAEEQKRKKNEAVLSQMDPLFGQLLSKLKSQLDWQQSAIINLKKSVKPGSPQESSTKRAEENVNRLSSEVTSFGGQAVATKAEKFANLGVLVDSVLSSNTSINNILKSIQVPLQERKTDLEKQISETVEAIKTVNDQIQQAAQKLKEVKSISETRGKLLSLKQKLTV